MTAQPESQPSTDGVVMRLTVNTNGSVDIWLDRGRSALEVAVMLRDIAAGFENEPRRVG